MRSKRCGRSSVQAAPAVSLSIVSHGQFALVRALLGDIARHCGTSALEVVLTVNVPEDLPSQFGVLPFPVRVIHNAKPLGFASNHNGALRQALGTHVCVLNPDVRLASDVLPELVKSLADLSVGVVAPLVLDALGKVEDSARSFPTPWVILLKALGANQKTDQVRSAAPHDVDWVGGMFMLMRREVFDALGGFDERYFLYYEDVDLCARIWLANMRVVQVRQVSVMHLARRSSHRSLRYLVVHLASMCRYFLSASFRATLWRSSAQIGLRRP